MKVALVKYNAGNTQSVIYALNRLGIEPLVTDDPAELKAADRVIFPGVGEANSAMKSLKAANLDKIIPQLIQPVLGICVGLQLLCSYSEENDTKCLDVMEVAVKRFPTTEKVPQIGWNDISGLKGPLFEGLEAGSYVYFVHSYFAEICEHTIATGNYVVPYSAALQKDNFYAVQFHAEKSGKVGSRILENFLNQQL